MKHKHNSKQISVIAVMIVVVLVWVSCPIYATDWMISDEDLSLAWYEKIDSTVYGKYAEMYRVQAKKYRTAS